MRGLHRKTLPHLLELHRPMVSILRLVIIMMGIVQMSRLPRLGAPKLQRARMVHLLETLLHLP